MRKDYGIAFIVLLLMAYVAIRSYTVDITHDEAYSFHVMKHFWYAEAFCTANTHWLNSIAIKTALLFHLENNWQIRWFSTLSAIVFFIVCFFWIRSLDKLYLKALAITLLLFNPFVLDYFGLARGYASGLMFEGISLFLFFYNLKRANRLIVFAALLCSGLSAIANYSFVYFFVAFAIVHFYTTYLKNGLRSLRSWGFYFDTAFCLVVSLFIILAWRFIIKCSNDLGAGTESITEACSSFINGLFYQQINVGNSLYMGLSFLLLAGITAICGYGIFKFKKHKQEVFFYCSLMLSIILVVLVVNYTCLHIVLPYARSALFLFPLVCICMVYFLNEVLPTTLNKITLILLSLLLLVNFCRTISFTHTLDFCAQEGTKVVFDYVDSIGAKHVGLSRELSGIYINYYQQTDRLQYKFKGNFIGNIEDLTECDYLLLSPHRSMLPYNHSKLKLDTIKHFKGNDVVLVRVHSL